MNDTQTVDVAPGLSRSLALIAAQAIVLFVLGVGLLGQLLLPNPGDPFAPSAGLAVLFAVIMPLTVAIVYFGSCRRPRRTLAEVGWVGTRMIQSILLGLLGAAACVVVLVALLAAMGDSLVAIGESLLAPSAARRVIFLIIGLHAAFTEETLFRGNLLGAFQARMGSVPAILVTSAVFAFYHLQFNPVPLLAKFVFGVVYAVLRRRSGSLVAPAIAHALFWTFAGSL